MSHLLPANAIFSPSVARIAASTARDWSHVDAWLAAKYRRLAPGRAPPAFERTPETLRALYALATLNEAADKDRDVVGAADAAALAGIRAVPDEQQADPPPLHDALARAVEDLLTDAAADALDAMAALAVATGTAAPSPLALGRAITELQAQVFETEQMAARVDALQQYLQDDALPETDAVLAELQQDGYQYSAELARQNLDTQRRIKAIASRLPEIQDRAASAKTAARLDGVPSFDAIISEEDEYLRLLAVKKELDAQLAIFHGLPTDVDVAYSELQNLRRNLHDRTCERDAIFENLVEQKTPRKLRR
ncbi:hypothetical protein BROUX41_006282 [Berkeleyomyces rouxiae]|uniref:uncharacterized protein n=1 Tax=Berkeleyomyces rouxiae TaxID=2035830 RepID=UPI003B7FDF53